MHKNTNGFITTALICFSLAHAAHAARPALRLYEISATRFVEHVGGELRAEHGLLAADGGWRQTDSTPVLSTVTVPSDARNKLLITVEAWLAYRRLGLEAVDNFTADMDGIFHTIGFREYMPVTVRPEARLDVGSVVNLSARGHVAAGITPTLIGGFVIEGQARRVLIRAIGPSLTALGVTDALADPFLTIQKGSTPIYFNGNWGERPDADEIAQAAAQVGAFPLMRSSKDAALLVELPPGGYTASVVSENASASGTALLEIYVMP